MKCVGCHKTPGELLEYSELAIAEGYDTAEQAMIAEEGTYNPVTGAFACTDCYVRMGQPTSDKGWKA